MAEQQGYDFIRYNALNLLGELLLKRDRLEQEAEVFTTVVEAAKRGLTAAELLRDSMTNLGEAEFRRRNYAATSRVFAEAIDLCAVNQDRLNSSMLLWRIAELGLAQGNYDRCAGFCQQAQQLAEELGAVMSRQKYFGPGRYWSRSGVWLVRRAAFMNGHERCLMMNRRVMNQPGCGYSLGSFCWNRIRRNWQRMS